MLEDATKGIPSTLCPNSTPASELITNPRRIQLRSGWAWIRQESLYSKRIKKTVWYVLAKGGNTLGFRHRGCLTKRAKM
jgi:hypothetical protein